MIRDRPRRITCAERKLGWPPQRRPRGVTTAAPPTFEDTHQAIGHIWPHALRAAEEEYGGVPKDYTGMLDENVEQQEARHHSVDSIVTDGGGSEYTESDFSDGVLYGEPAPQEPPGASASHGPPPQPCTAVVPSQQSSSRALPRGLRDLQGLPCIPVVDIPCCSSAS